MAIVNDGYCRDIREFRNTTTALRSAAGFVLYTASHFMEMRISSKMNLAAGWPPTETELGEMFRHFYGAAGRCTWQQTSSGWQGEHEIVMASDPTMVGSSFGRRLSVEAGQAASQQDDQREQWRQLSPAGSSPLSGAWKTHNDLGDWLYLTSAGHYAVMRSETQRLVPQSKWAQLPASELAVLAQNFGANAGARVETSASFDHWPMIGQIAGYDVRKHETFKLEEVEASRFSASMPPFDFPPDTWTRIGD